MLAESSHVELITTAPAPIIRGEKTETTATPRAGKAGWPLVVAVVLFLIALIDGIVLYKYRLTTPFKDYLPLATDNKANTCQIFYAPNEHVQEHYQRLLNNHPSLCAAKEYVFLNGYSKAGRIAAFVCNSDARRDTAAFCTTHYFWAHEP